MDMKLRTIYYNDRIMRDISKTLLPDKGYHVNGPRREGRPGDTRRYHPTPDEWMKFVHGIMFHTQREWILFIAPISAYLAKDEVDALESFEAGMASLNAVGKCVGRPQLLLVHRKHGVTTVIKDVAGTNMKMEPHTYMNL